MACRRWVRRRDETVKLLQASGAVALLFSLLSACETPSSCPRLSACKVNQTMCQQHIMNVAACQRKVDPRPLPPVEILTAESFATIAAEETTATPIDIEKAIERRGFSLLGLASPSETDLSLKNASNARLGGYFDGTKVVLLVNSWNTDAAITKILLHEFVHVLQVPDQPSMPQRKSFDEFLANRAVVEGEATFIADRAVIEAQGVRADDIDWSTHYWRMLAPGSGTNILSNAYSQFTYRYGAYYLSLLTDAERRSVWQHMPTTTRQVMPGGRFRSAVDAPTMPSPVLPPSFKRKTIATLGQWMWTSRWRDSLPAVNCTRSLPNIAQDTFSVYHDEASGEIVASWRVRLDPDQKTTPDSAVEQLKSCYERRLDVLVGADDQDIWLVVTTRADRPPPVQGWQTPPQEVDAGAPDAQ
jgi:hypothetical protein